MEQIIRKTKGFCHKCLKEVPAETVLIDGFVHIRTKCKKHRTYTARHVWDDPKIYEFFDKLQSSTNIFSKSKSSSKFFPARTALIVTDRCNMTSSVE